jgi:predicted methyltransferase
MNSIASTAGGPDRRIAGINRKPKRAFVMAALAAAAAAVLLSACGTADGGAAAPAVSHADASISSGTGILTAQQIDAIVANPNRSAADRNSDLQRKPAHVLAFIGLRPGMVVLDLSAAGGYTTELLARAVGPNGRVYGQSPPPRDANSPPQQPAVPEGNAAPPVAGPATATAAAMAAAPAAHLTSPQALAARSAADTSLANIVPVVRPFEDPVPPELAAGRLDVVTLMFNYHDLGHWGVDRAQMNRKVFAALKPGGMYVIADHAGRPGTGISESGTLHRIEESFLRSEVEAAGFKQVDEGFFLRNPSDPRDKNTPEPPQPKDQFILKFIKP